MTDYVAKQLIKRVKRGRPRSENPMVHTAVVLPRALLEQLRKDAEISGRGLSTEIRHKLQLVTDIEGMPSNPATIDLKQIALAINDLTAVMEYLTCKDPHWRR